MKDKSEFYRIRRSSWTPCAPLTRFLAFYAYPCAPLPRRRKSIEKPPGRLQAKPISVNFPKRDETVVKRKVRRP